MFPDHESQREAEVEALRGPRDLRDTEEEAQGAQRGASERQ